MEVAARIGLACFVAILSSWQPWGGAAEVSAGDCGSRPSRIKWRLSKSDPFRDATLRYWPSGPAVELLRRGTELNVHSQRSGYSCVTVRTEDGRCVSGWVASKYVARDSSDRLNDGECKFTRGGSGRVVFKPMRVKGGGTIPVYYAPGSKHKVRGLTAGPFVGLATTPTSLNPRSVETVNGEPWVWVSRRCFLAKTGWVKLADLEEVDQANPPAGFPAKCRHAVCGRCRAGQAPYRFDIHKAESGIVRRYCSRNGGHLQGRVAFGDRDPANFGFCTASSSAVASSSAAEDGDLCGQEAGLDEDACDDPSSDAEDTDDPGCERGDCKTCTARCCGSGDAAPALPLSATSSAQHCEAQGEQACAAQGTTLHHVRFDGKDADRSSWRPCARECCARCTNRDAYHQVTQADGDWVFESCTEHARAWCAVGDRGPVVDAAWTAPRNDGTDQCQLPPQTCTARCCDAEVVGTPETSSAAQCDAQGQAACAGRGSSLHHVRFGGAEQPAHACAQECCALCGNRLAYHLVTDGGDRVWEGCREAADAYCSESDRGGLDDAAWAALKGDGTDQCVPPAGYCRMLCHDGAEDSRHVTDEQQCWDATQRTCGAHGGTEVLSLDGRELYRRPAHTCTVRCCDGAVVGPVNSNSASECIYNEGPPLCAQRGSTVNHVRYDGALVKAYDCPQTCTARCCNGAIIGTTATTSSAQCDAQGQQACASQGTTLDHVRFAGNALPGHPCPQLCYGHCCNGTQGEVWLTSQDQCWNWVAGALCGGVKVNTIHWPKYNVIYNADSCRCCAKCRKRDKAYNVGPFSSCTDRARDWCSKSDRGGLENAYWGSCPDAPN